MALERSNLPCADCGEEPPGLWKTNYIHPDEGGAVLCDRCAGRRQRQRQLDAAPFCPGGCGQKLVATEGIRITDDVFVCWDCWQRIDKNAPLIAVVGRRWRMEKWYTQRLMDVLDCPHWIEATTEKQPKRRRCIWCAHAAFAEQVKRAEV